MSLAANRSRRKTASVDLYNSKTGGITQGSARKSKKRNFNPKRVSIHDIDFNQSLIQSPVVDRLHHSIIEQRVPTPTLAERASTLKTLAQDALSFLLSPVATKSDPIAQRRWETFESFKSSTFTSGHFISIDQVLRGQNRTSETAMTISHGIRMSNITTFAYIINHQSATVDSKGEIRPSVNLKEAWQSFLPFIIPESNKVHKRHVDMLIELGTQVYNLKQLIVSHTQKQSDASRLQAESVRELKLELFNFKATFKNVDKKKLSTKIETHFLKKAKDRAQSILRLPVESLDNEYPYEEFKDLIFNYLNTIWDQEGSNIGGSPGNASAYGSSVEDEELTDVLNVSRLLQPDQSQSVMEHHTQRHPIDVSSNMPQLLSGDNRSLHNDIGVNLDLDSHIDNVNGSIFSEQPDQSVAHLKDFFDEPPQGESTFFLHSTPDRRSNQGDRIEDALREGSISVRSEGRGPINIEHLLNHQHHVSTDAVINADDVFGGSATDTQGMPHLSDGSSSHNGPSDQSTSPNNQTMSSSSSSDTNNTQLREARDGVLSDMADILGSNIKDQSLLARSRQIGDGGDGNTGAVLTRTSSSMPPPSNSQKNLDKRTSLQSLNTATPTLKYIKEKIGGRTRQSKRLALITEQTQDGVLEEEGLRHQPLSQVTDAQSNVDLQLRRTGQRSVDQEGSQKEVEEAQRREANETQKRRNDEARNSEAEEQQRINNERREAEEEEVRFRLEQQRQSEEEHARHEQQERDQQAEDEIHRQAEAEQLRVAQESEQAKIQNQHYESLVNNSAIDASEEPPAEPLPETVGPSDYWNQINDDPLPFASDDYAIMEAAEGSDNGGMGRRPSIMSWVEGSSDGTPTARQRATEKQDAHPIDPSSPSGTYGQPRIITRRSVRLSNSKRSPTRRASRRNKQAYDGSSEEENNVVLQSPNQGVRTQNNRVSETTNNDEEKPYVLDITSKKISKEIIVISDSDDEVYEGEREEEDDDNDDDDDDDDDRYVVENQLPSQHDPSSPSSRRAPPNVSQNNQQRKQKNVRLVSDSESDEEEDEQAGLDQHNRVRARQARQEISRKKADYGFHNLSQKEKDEYVRTKGLNKTYRPQLSQRGTTNSGRRVRIPIRAYESDLIIRYVINEYRLARKYGERGMYGMYSRMITDHGFGGRYSQILQDRHNVDIKDYVYKYSSNKLINMEKLHPAFRTTYGCQDAASYMFYDDTDSEEEADGMRATNQTQIKREVARKYDSVAEFVERLAPGASAQRISTAPPQINVTNSDDDADYEEVDQLSTVEPRERTDRLRTATSNGRSGTKRPRSRQEFNESNEEFTEAPPVRGKRRAVAVDRNTVYGE